MHIVQEKINAATLAHAHSWAEAEDGNAFCVEYLGIGRFPITRAESWVDALQEKFESLLAKEERALHPTNVDFITDLMEHSNYGALAQIFVIDALGKWSDKIAACTPEQVDTPFINGEAWVGVAREIQGKLAARLKKS